MRVLHALTITVAALLLGACGSHSASSGIGPTDPTIGNGAGTPAAAPFHPLFAVAQGILPYPTDLYFAGSSDGTLRLPASDPFFLNATAINGLDGFSTVAPITVRFSTPIDSSTLSPADVVVIRLTLDNATKGPLLPPAAGGQLPRALVYGTDYTVYVSGHGPAGALAQAVDSGGSTLVIEPTRPLDPSSGATNIGYLVLLTNGIKDLSGHSAGPDKDYATVQGGALADLAAGKTTPTCSSVTDATLNLVCQLTFGHLAIAAGGGLDPTSVVLSFSFSTQSTADTLNVLWATYQATPVPAGTIAAVPIGKTTLDLLGPPSPGYADIWVGTVTLPYYLTAAANPHDTAPLTAFWTAEHVSPIDATQTSKVLTRFNPVPHKTSNQAVPLIVGVPRASAAPHCAKPTAGWPVVVFMHGITRNRTDALAIMDAYTGHCFVVVAIDQPLHGIVDPTSPLYRNQLLTGSPYAGLITGERTFDLDVENNTTLAAGPDGAIDPSGDHYVNLTSFLTLRDNMRQANSDLLWLARVLPSLSFGVNPAGDVDGSQLQIAGQSLGSIASTPTLAVVSLQTGQPNSPYLSGLLSVDGGAFAYIGRDSPAFAPRINGSLNIVSGGLLVPGATMYDNFIRDAQTAIDAGDPLNYVAAAVHGRPVLLQQVVGGAPLPDGTMSLPDQVIPNTNSHRLLVASNVTRFTAGAPAPLATGSGAYVNFIYGNHGSLLDPRGSTNTAATNGATWLEMQTEAVAFALARGTAVTVGAGSPAVVQP